MAKDASNEAYFASFDNRNKSQHHHLEPISEGQVKAHMQKNLFEVHY